MDPIHRAIIFGSLDKSCIVPLPFSLWWHYRKMVKNYNGQHAIFCKLLLPRLRAPRQCHQYGQLSGSGLRLRH